MKIAILLAVVSCACAAPRVVYRRSVPEQLEAAPITVVWPEDVVPRPKRDTPEQDRASFLRILEDLNAIAREEPREDAQANYFAIIGVFDMPFSEQPLVLAERVPIDQGDLLDQLEDKPEDEPEDEPEVEIARRKREGCRW